MEKYKLTKITRYTNDKAGQPLKTKDGRPYTRVNIQTAQHGQSWISGFGSNTNVDWKEGDEVELVIDTKKVGDKEYLNFSEPKKIDEVNEKMEKILNKLTAMNLMLNSIFEHTVPQPKPKVGNTDIDYPENDIGEPQF